MPKDTKKGPQKGPLNSAYAKYSGIGIQMFAIIGLGAFAGVQLDAYLGNENNLYTIIISLVAVFAAMYFVIRQILKMSNKDH